MTLLLKLPSLDTAHWLAWSAAARSRNADSTKAHDGGNITDHINELNTLHKELKANRPDEGSLDGGPRDREIKGLFSRSEIKERERRMEKGDSLLLLLETRTLCH